MDEAIAVPALVAGVSIVVSFATARHTVNSQARAHREQMATQERQFRQELETQIQQARDSADREHFARLWEKRQDGYLHLAAWALAVRRSIETEREADRWEPVSFRELDDLAQVALYADYQVYAQAELLRGEYEQTVRNLEEFASALPEDSRTKLLEPMGERAWELLGIVRENALRPPDWREPIPLRAPGAEQE